MLIATLVGNLGRDAESKQVGQSNVVEFSVAHSRKVKGAESTVWVRCNYWGKPGEAVLPYLTKGKSVAVTGELTLREYTGRDGSAKSSLEMRVDQLQLVGGRSENGASRREEPAATFAEEDIPF